MTTATAMGDALRIRLEGAGIRFSVVDKSGPVDVPAAAVA